MIEENENQSAEGNQEVSELEEPGQQEVSEPVTYEITVTDEPRPFLTTDFADYSVSEGLLLSLLLLAFISCLWRILRGAFSWLL